MSFFGFDASIPPATDAPLQEFGDEMNDETFGVDVKDLKTSEFVFSQQSPAKTTQGPRVFTVEELEAQMIAPQQQVLTVEELERQLTGTMQLDNANHEPEDDSYNGVMMAHEKEFVAKVQLAQLASDPSYIQDFYYKRFMNKRRGVKIPDISLIISGVDSSTQQNTGNESEQEKFARILSEVKNSTKIKADKLAFEGALGKVAVSSLKNPKKLLELSAKALTPDTNSEGGKSLRLSFKKVLASIERILQELILIDDLYLEYEDAKGRDVGGDDHWNDLQKKWNQKYTRIIKNIWAEFHNVISSPSTELKPNSELLKAAPPEKNLILLLSVSKGRKALPRIIKFLPRDQLMILLKTLFLSMKSIIITSADPVSVLAELDEYSNCVVYPFVPAISESPISFVVDCLNTVISSGDLISVARSKPGLLFLTLFITRAEKARIDRSSGNSSNGSDAEILLWSQSLFPKLFESFQTRFSALFPPSTIMPSILDSSSTAIPKPIPVDDTYVWQFLASVALGSSLEQQRILVTEARDKIFEVVTTQGQEGTKKANLLLHALGLDASQLSL